MSAKVRGSQPAKRERGAMSTQIDAFDMLVGQTITKLTLNDDATELEFATPSGRFVFQAEGDCCSDSWFNHLSGVSALLGQTVRNVIEREVVIASGTRQDEDRVYGWSLVTDLGHVDLELRNSSNGYYGGWAYLLQPDEPLTGRIITEDF